METAEDKCEMNEQIKTVDVRLVAALLQEANARIEALEFEVEHERYNVEKTAQEAAKRIKALEAALKEAGEMWIRKDNRIEMLEAALHRIEQSSNDHIAIGIARAARAQSSPPKAST